VKGGGGEESKGKRERERVIEELTKKIQLLVVNKGRQML